MMLAGNVLIFAAVSVAAAPRCERKPQDGSSSSLKAQSTTQSSNVTNASKTSKTSTPSPTPSILPVKYYDIAFGQPRSTIDGYTKETIQNLIKGVKPDLGQFASAADNAWWPAHNGWTSIADFDAIHKTKEYAAAVSKGQDALAQLSGGCSDWGVPLVNCYNDDSGWAALGNVQAYTTYGDSKYLDRAKAIFEFLTGHGYVSAQVLRDGYLKGTKNSGTTIKSECNGTSMIGAVYWQNGSPSDPNYAGNTNADVNAVSTGLYALLGADLCRVTKNNDYCTAAYSSLQWLDRHLVNSDGLLYDHLDSKTCGLKGWVFTYNAGLYIAAYAELGSLTNNATATKLAERTIAASIKTTQWNDANGVIKEGAGDATGYNDSVGFKAIMIRYLRRSHSWVSKEVQRAIVEYINIQFYAITQLDSNDKTHPVDYGRNWEGPFQVASSRANMVALDVLNGISLNSDSAFPSTGSGPVASINN